MFQKMLQGGSGGQQIVSIVDYVADSYFGNYVAKNAFDNNSNTFWIANSISGYIDITLSKELSHVVLEVRSGYFNSNNRTETIQLSDISETQVFSVTNAYLAGSTILSADFNNPTNKIRVKCTGNGDAFGSLSILNLLTSY